MRINKYASFVYGTLAASALLAFPTLSAIAADASANPVTCKDGTTSPHGGRGSCSGHGGIDKAATKAAAGGAASDSAPAAPVKPTPAAPTPAPTAAPPPTPAAPPATTSSAPKPASVSKSSTASQAPAPGGGPGMVWVNTASKVYHCPSDRYYGKTKAGEYMTEADAKSKGNRADHNKPCS
jgi:hypothetical protein